MDLTKGSVPKVLFVFSLPIVLQMSIQPLFGVVDRIFIGQIGPDAFNAVTNAAVLQMLVILLAAGLANGVASYVARLVGKGDYAEADNAANHAMIIMLVFSALCIGVFYPFDRVFFRILGTRPEYMERAHDFTKVIILGNVTIMFTIIGSNILRAEGDSKTPLIIAVLSVGLNLVLAPLFIFSRDESVFGMNIGWLGLDVMGGALATVVARGLGCAILIWYLIRSKSIWSFSLKNFHWHPAHIIEILRVGLPMLLVNLTSWVASIIFLRVLNPYPAAVVAWGMGTQFDMLAILPMIGLMLGVVAMVGQNYGAGSIERAAQSAWVGGLYAAGFAVLIALAFMGFPDFWISLFNKGDDPEIRRLGIDYIHIVSLTYPFVAQLFVLGGAFQGLGKGTPPLVVTVVRFLFVSVPLVLILPPVIGPQGAWYAAAASHLVGGILAIAWIWWEFRKRLSVVK